MKVKGNYAQLNSDYPNGTYKTGTREKSLTNIDEPSVNPHFLNGKSRDIPFATDKVVPRMPNKM